MTQIEKFAFALLTTAFSVQAIAHPGHDHNSWTASPIHAIFYFSIAATIVLAVAFFTVKTLKSKKDNTQD